MAVSDWCRCHCCGSRARGWLLGWQWVKLGLGRGLGAALDFRVPEASLELQWPAVLPAVPWASASSVHDVDNPTARD